MHTTVLAQHQTQACNYISEKGTCRCLHEVHMLKPHLLSSMLLMEKDHEVDLGILKNGWLSIHSCIHAYASLLARRRDFKSAQCLVSNE